MSDKANKIQNGLQHFHGSETVFQIPLLKTRYTEGINFLARAADCFWLVTDTSVIAKSLMNRSYFITVDFKKFTPEEEMLYGYGAKITYGDGNGNIFEEHKYHVTDFPLDELRLYFIDNTLMLPSEY